MKRIIFSIVVFAVLLSSCKFNNPVYSNFNGFIQGSTYSIVYENKKNLDPGQLRQRVEKILHDFDKSLSLYNDSSVISKINRNEDVVVDSFFTEAFKKSSRIFEISDGAFDITVGPLVKAWGFGPDGHKSFTDARRDSLMKLVGMEKVSLVNGKVIKSDPHISLDLNAIAQLSLIHISEPTRRTPISYA